MRTLALSLIDLYRSWMRPLIPPTCRFSPSCSDYTHGAITAHGLAKGGALGLRRLLRCHPWSEGGLDPVPDDRTS